MSLKVIGAGLGRTGTLSLKLALEHLGFGPCDHMTEVMGHARTRLPLWLDAVAGRPDWDAVFAGYNATVDYPGCTWWRELADKFPQAKVILSDRDAGAWYESVRETIMSPAAVERLMEGPLHEFMMGAIFAPILDHLDDRAWMIDWYDRRRTEVIASLPPERLLVHRSVEGWEPLCRFLGVPVPDGKPFPRLNDRQTFKDRIEQRRQEAAEAPR